MDATTHTIDVTLDVLRTERRCLLQALKRVDEQLYQEAVRVAFLGSTQVSAQHVCNTLVTMTQTPYVAAMDKANAPSLVPLTNAYH